MKSSKKPIRIVSRNKTASQRSTNKFTQGFLALELINKKKESNSKLRRLTETKMQKIMMEAESLGYTNKSEKYDFFINSILSKYEMPDSKAFKIVLNKSLQD